MEFIVSFLPIPVAFLCISDETFIKLMTFLNGITGYAKGIKTLTTNFASEEFYNFSIMHVCVLQAVSSFMSKYCHKILIVITFTLFMRNYIPDPLNSRRPNCLLEPSYLAFAPIQCSYFVFSNDLSQCFKCHL